jgi:hypothetical protein
VSGSITYNGHPAAEVVVPRAVAYVSQNDEHTPQLTVDQTLKFSRQCAAHDGFKVGGCGVWGVGWGEGGKGVARLAVDHTHKFGPLTRPLTRPPPLPLPLCPLPPGRGHAHGRAAAGDRRRRRAGAAAEEQAAGRHRARRGAGAAGLLGPLPDFRRGAAGAGGPVPASPPCARGCNRTPPPRPSPSPPPCAPQDLLAELNHALGIAGGGKPGAFSQEILLRAMGLLECRGTPVGGAMARGISGGQRKRVTTVGWRALWGGFRV